MARRATIPRDEVVQGLQRTFRSAGYDGASLALLSAETGLAKAGLYHHFPGGKREMAAAVFENVGVWMKAHVLEPLRAAGEPRARLLAMTAALDGYYGGGQQACLLDLFSTGGARPHFQAQLRGGVQTWIAAIATALADAGLRVPEAQLRAEDAVLRIEGALVVSRALGDSGPFARLLKRLPDELLARLEPAPPVARRDRPALPPRKARR
jgi:AcrR family transcriptional regulator